MRPPRPSPRSVVGCSSVGWWLVGRLARHCAADGWLHAGHARARPFLPAGMPVQQCTCTCPAPCVHACTCRACLDKAGRWANVAAHATPTPHPHPRPHPAHRAGPGPCLPMRPSCLLPAAQILFPLVIIVVLLVLPARIGDLNAINQVRWQWPSEIGGLSAVGGWVVRLGGWPGGGVLAPPPRMTTHPPTSQTPLKAFSRYQRGPPLQPCLCVALVLIIIPPSHHHDLISSRLMTRHHATRHPRRPSAASSAPTTPAPPTGCTSCSRATSTSRPQRSLCRSSTTRTAASRQEAGQGQRVSLPTRGGGQHIQIIGCKWHLPFSHFI